MRNITYINVTNAYITRNDFRVRLFGEVVPSADGEYQVMGEISLSDAKLSDVKASLDQAFEEAYTYDITPGKVKGTNNITIKGSMYITGEELDTLHVGH